MTADPTVDADSDVESAGSPAPNLPTPSRRRLVAEGGRDILPMVVGVAPLALAIGASIAASARVPDLAGWAGGPLIFGGAAQLSTVGGLDSGVAPPVVIISALLLNARVLMYGAAAAPWFRSTSLPGRLALAVPLIDPLYLVCAARFERGDLDEAGRRAYYAGAAGVLAVSWMAIQAGAIVAGASLADVPGLRTAGLLAFAALLARSSIGRPAVAAACVGGVIAVVGAGLPFQSAVLVAALSGVAFGGPLARLSERIIPGGSK